MTYKNRDWLREKYIGEEKSYREISEECEVCPSTIRYWLRKFNIPTRSYFCSSSGTEGKYGNKEWLEKKYLQEEMTFREIADECEVSYGTIQRWIEKFNIPTRRPGYPYNHIEITDDFLEALEGLLLGDGSLEVGPSENSGTRYSHGDSFEDFLIFLSEYLKNFGLEEMNIYRKIDKKNGNISYEYVSLTYRELGDVEQKWYDHRYIPKRKSIPEGFEISPTKLFWWYLGDGTHSSSQTSICSTILRKNLPRIQSQLQDLGIEASVNVSGLNINKKTRDQFFSYILDSEIPVPLSYRYKFRGYL